MITKQNANTVRPLALGTGLVALDLIYESKNAIEPHLSTGGTCGNVLLILQYLGFQSVPISRLGNDPAADFIFEEMKDLGVSTKLITSSEDGSTPVIVQTNRISKTGEPYHTFGWRCPTCGARFPSYKPVLASEAETVAATLPECSVFFLDRVTRGALVLATAAQKAGALVVFEPSGIGDATLFQEAWSLANVVKYAHERLADLPEGLEFGNELLLQIETLGADGLRYRTRLKNRKISRWRLLEAITASSIVDASGAGDWCTAGILHQLGRKGRQPLENATASQVKKALKFGQALAAWNCAYLGARGGMKAVDSNECIRQVELLLCKESEIKSEINSNSNADSLVRWCQSCPSTIESTKKNVKSKLAKAQH